jgi:hypothetical protein
MPAGFTSYIVRQFPFISFGRCNRCNFVFLSFDLIVTSILRRIMAYSSSVHNSID